jgi:hypothetical protein
MERVFISDELQAEMDAIIDAAPDHIWTEEDIALQNNAPRRPKRNIQEQSEIEK